MSASFVIVGTTFVDSLYGSTVDAENRTQPIIISHGGVGRNIAENLGWLGQKTRFVTLLSATEEGRDIGEGLNPARVVLAARYVEEGIGSYIGVRALTGEVMRHSYQHPPFEQLDWQFVRKHLDPVPRCIVFESGANPSMVQDLLAFSHANDIFTCGVPTCLDIHGPQQASLLGATCLIMNQEEAALVLGVPVTSRQDSVAAVRTFLERGVREVLITMGAEGVVAGEYGGSLVVVPACDVQEVISTSGCGDAFVAAYLAARMAGATLRVAVSLGQERASRTTQTMSAVLAEPTTLR